MHYIERPLSSLIPTYPNQSVQFVRQPYMPPQMQIMPAQMNMVPQRYLYPQQMVHGMQGMARPMGYGMFF